jgi:hypothetical protein
MTKTGVKIKDLALGDDFRVQRTYTGLPSGVTIATAWMTVKRSERLDDSDALFQKEITTAGTSAGHITDADTTDGDIDMYFEVAGADFAAASPNLEYVYDIQVKTSSNQIHTLEKGTIAFIRDVTQTTT